MEIIPEIIWNEISNVILKNSSRVGRPLKDPRITLSGIFHILGCVEFSA